jgi:hypothetical protein
MSIVMEWMVIVMKRIMIRAELATNTTTHAREPLREQANNEENGLLMSQPSSNHSLSEGALSERAIQVILSHRLDHGSFT